MNEKTEAAPPKALEEAPAGFRPPAPIEGPWCPTGRPEEFPGEDLGNGDLAEIKGLLPEHLAGADLTGAKLPEEIAKFPALAQVAAISSEARKIFIGLLAACVYSWLVIGTTEDVQLIVNTATWPLPVINAPIAIVGFYVVGGTLLAAIYCYLHFYLQRLWRTLATLPAVFPDGVDLDDKTDPWLLTNLVRTDFVRLRGHAPPLARMENLLAIVLAWGVVPVTLLALWARYLPAHGWLGTSWLVILVGLCTLFGRDTYRLARAALQGNMLPVARHSDRGQGIVARAWHEFRHIRPDRLTVGLMAVLIVCSVSAFRDNPRDPYTWVAKGMNAVGIRTYAGLIEVNVAERPDGWDFGRDWNTVKRIDLRGSNLAFADATRAFLANADLRGANLRDAILVEAELRGADLYDDDARKVAQLQNADLTHAQLQGADLGDAQLQGADLSGAQLQGANLSYAQLQGANLSEAQLQGANLFLATLWGATLGLAKLQGATLTGAQLQGAGLDQAQLQGADLKQARTPGRRFEGNAGLACPGRCRAMELGRSAREYCPADDRFRYRRPDQRGHERHFRRAYANGNGRKVD